MFKDSWQFNRSRSKSEKFLEGAIDLHVHPGPHLFSSPRSTDPIKTAIEARNAGMRAFAIMDVNRERSMRGGAEGVGFEPTKPGLPT